MKIGTDIYIEDQSKHKYFGVVKDITEDQVGATFGTDEIIYHNKQDIKIS